MSGNLCWLDRNRVRTGRSTLRHIHARTQTPCLVSPVSRASLVSIAGRPEQCAVKRSPSLRSLRLFPITLFFIPSPLKSSSRLITARSRPAQLRLLSRPLCESRMAQKHRRRRRRSRRRTWFVVYANTGCFFRGGCLDWSKGEGSGHCPGPNEGAAPGYPRS